MAPRQSVSQPKRKKGPRRKKKNQPNKTPMPLIECPLDLCRKLIRKDSLTKHLMTHKRGTIVCSTCHKVFARKSTLAAHQEKCTSGTLSNRGPNHDMTSFLSKKPLATAALQPSTEIDAGKVENPSSIPIIQNPSPSPPNPGRSKVEEVVEDDDADADGHVSRDADGGAVDAIDPTCDDVESRSSGESNDHTIKTAATKRLQSSKKRLPTNNELRATPFIFNNNEAAKSSSQFPLAAKQDSKAEPECAKGNASCFCTALFRMVRIQADAQVLMQDCVAAVEEHMTKKTTDAATIERYNVWIRNVKDCYGPMLTSSVSVMGSTLAICSEHVSDPIVGVSNEMSLCKKMKMR